ncbi:hypothetical protein JXM83_00730 [Candidatus Woesearchaeota archaeon]|nr:hypothetical protein [Candidatus Woesearchaeota archaeon]
MEFREPNSMDECLYFTNRDDPSVGQIRAWVLRLDCPKCKKGKMGKPVDSKTGRPKIRATEYVCSDCGYTEEKLEHEAKCTVMIDYTCTCGHHGTATTEYKRKSWNGIPSYVFVCGGCGNKIGITKKMKGAKKK